MKQGRIKPISDKQKEKNAHWKKVTDERCEELDYICQYCGRKGQRDNPNDPWTYLDGHHTVKRRYNIHTKEVCYPCHRLPCHSFIEDNNIEVAIGDYKLRELFL